MRIHATFTQDSLQLIWKKVLLCVDDEIVVGLEGGSGGDGNGDGGSGGDGGDGLGGGDGGGDGDGGGGGGGKYSAIASINLGF